MWFAEQNNVRKKAPLPPLTNLFFLSLAKNRLFLDMLILDGIKKLMNTALAGTARALLTPYTYQRTRSSLHSKNLLEQTH